VGVRCRGSPNGYNLQGAMRNGSRGRSSMKGYHGGGTLEGSIVGITLESVR
jgi:hypothetical protein